MSDSGHAATTHRPSRQPSSFALVFGFLAAPVAWLVHLATASALVPVACELDSVLIVHATTVVIGVLALGGILVARRNGAAGSDANSYARFLAVGGFWLGILFLALILLEGLPVFVLETCE